MRDRGRLGPARRPQLGQDVGDVDAGRLRRDEQLGADLLVAVPGGQQPQHLDARGRSARPAARAPHAARPRRPAGAGDPARRPRSASAASSGAARSSSAAAAGQQPFAGRRLARSPASASASASRQRDRAVSYTNPGAERVDDRLPGRRVIVAVDPAPLRLGPGQPAPAVDAEREPVACAGSPRPPWRSRPARWPAATALASGRRRRQPPWPPRPDRRARRARPRRP